MRKDSIILIAEDDDSHFTLIQDNLQHGGISNEILRFTDGQQILDFLFATGSGPVLVKNKEYILFLDIHMPTLDGVRVLEKIKQDPKLKKIPVVMLTVSDDPDMVQRCHELGCSIYMVKPADNESFANAVQKLGMFLSFIEAPRISTV